jgi:hypothetical protein
MMLRTGWTNTFYNNEHASHCKTYCNDSKQLQLTTQPTKFFFLRIVLAMKCKLQQYGSRIGKFLVGENIARNSTQF